MQGAELLGERGGIHLLQADQVEVMPVDQREELADGLVLLEVVAEDAHHPTVRPGG
jgi:hypothetical protein